MLDVNNSAILKEEDMKTFTAVVERCPDTGLFVGHVPGLPGAHSQAKTLDELGETLKKSSKCFLRMVTLNLNPSLSGHKNVLVA